LYERSALRRGGLAASLSDEFVGEGNAYRDVFAGELLGALNPLCSGHSAQFAVLRQDNSPDGLESWSRSHVRFHYDKEASQERGCSEGHD